MTESDLMITGYFQNRQCASCGRFFDDESVKIIKRMKESVIVKIDCRYCGMALGTALVNTGKKH